MSPTKQTTSQMGLVSSSVEAARRPATYTPSPTHVGTSHPTRSLTEPEMGPTTAFTMGSTMNSRLDTPAESPWASWK